MRLRMADLRLSWFVLTALVVLTVAPRTEADPRLVDEARYPRTFSRSAFVAASGYEGSSPRIESHAISQLRAGALVSDTLRLGGIVAWARTRATFDPAMGPLDLNGLGVGPLVSYTSNEWCLNMVAPFGYFGDRWTRNAELMQPTIEGCYAVSDKLLFTVGVTSTVRWTAYTIYPIGGWIYKTGEWNIAGVLPFWANAMRQMSPALSMGVEARLAAASYHLSVYGPRARTVVGLVFVGPRVQLEPISGIEIGIGGGLAYNAFTLTAIDMPGSGQFAGAINFDLQFTEALLHGPHSR